jgi:hypothetical protein
MMRRLLTLALVLLLTPVRVTAQQVILAGNSPNTTTAVTVGAALPAGTNNIGDVDVLTLPALPAGTNNIGDVDIASIAAGDNNIGNVDVLTLPNVTNAGTFAVQESGAALTALQLIDNLVLAEDGVHSSGEVGILTFAVRNDAQAALAADGDRIPLSVNSQGALYVTGGGGGTEYTEGDTDATITGHALLWEDTGNTLRTISAATPMPVTCPDCSGTGVSDVDDSSFTVTSDDLAPTGYLFDDVTPDSVDEGDIGVPRMAANRIPYGIIRDGAAGAERGASVTANNELLVELGAGAASIGTLGANSGVDIGDVTLTAGTADIGNVNLEIGGTAITAGAGAVAATTIRMTLASDDPAVVSLQLLDNAISGAGFNITQLAGATTPMTTTQADGLALTLDALNVASFGYVYNGTTLDLMRGDATNGVLVNLGANNDVTVTGSVTVTATNLDVQSGGADLATEATAAAILTSTNFAAAFGTAGTADTQVLSVQGIASMTPLLVNPGTAASWGVHAEDSAHSSTHAGVQVLAVRQDSQVDFGADGDYVPLSINDAGELRVAFAGAAGGTSLADDADFTDGTTPGTPIGGVAEQASPSTVTEGDFGWVAITLNRAMKVTLFDTAGNALTPSVDQVEDDAFANADTGPMVLAVRDDTLGAHSGTDGDFEPLHTNANGALWVQDVNIGTIFGTDAIFGTAGTADADVLSVQGIASMTPLLVNPGTAANFAIYVEDAGETAGGNLAMAGTVRRDTAASSAGTTADNATLNTDASGLLWTRAMDPCTANNTTTIPISVAADTAVIAAGGGSTRTYICGGVLVASAAEVVNIWEGTGTACGTSSAALAGSTTEANGMSLAANGGFEVSRTIRGIGTNVDVCVRLSATNRVSGWLSYVQVAQ